MRLYLKDHRGWHHWKNMVISMVSTHGRCTVTGTSFPLGLLGEERELALYNLALISRGHRPDDSPTFECEHDALAWMANELRCSYSQCPITGNITFVRRPS